MGYKEDRRKEEEKYKELLMQYETLTADPHYTRICEEMPFAFLEAKQKAETLELYRDLEKKEDAPFKFSRADEAINFLRGIMLMRGKVDEILENAAVIVRAGEIAKKINRFVEESPYLPAHFKLDENNRLVQIATDCLTMLPGYKDLCTNSFRLSFIESCIESLNRYSLQKVVEAKYIKPDDMKDIRLTGSKNYEENIAFLQTYFGLSELICEHRKIRLAGTSKPNADGTSRQDFLKSLQGYQGEIELKCTPGIFHNTKNGKDLNSVEISWNGNVLGYVPQAIVDEMYEKYGTPQFKAEFVQIVGGDSVYYGCEVDLGIVAKKKVLQEEMENEHEMV